MYYDKLFDLGIKLTRRGGLEKTLCPQCSNSRKNKKDKCLSVNVTTGEYNCHNNCGFRGNVRGQERRRDSRADYKKPDADYVKTITQTEKAINWFASRKIGKATLDKFSVFTREEYMPQTQKKENCICFPYFRSGELVNIKFRTGAKEFKMVAGAELIFYNLDSIAEKKKVVLVEGEIDCLSVYEAGIGKEYDEIIDSKDEETGEVKTHPHPYSEYGIVSVPNGASISTNARMEYLDNCADWFLGLDDIVIATDDDEAGRALKDELVRRIGAERCRIVSYPKETFEFNGIKRRCKDFNEVLLHINAQTVCKCVEDAEPIPVDGIWYLDDVAETMWENFKKGSQLAPTTRFDEMDSYFRWKKGDVNLVTGYANHGKTFYWLQMMLTKSIWDDWRWAVFCPENFPANDFYDDLIEMYSGKWLRNMSDDEYLDACFFINEHFFYVYPENDHSLLSVHDKFRYLILKKGVDGVLVDPWNQLDHEQKTMQRDDQYLSQALKDVKRFALINAVSYNIIAHPKNPTYNQDKSLPIADMYDLHGGSLWGNKSDQIISYHRPRFHEDKNSPECEIYLQKVKRKRTGGQLGSFSLRLNWGMKRYEESDGRIPCDPKLAEKHKAGDIDYTKGLNGVSKYVSQFPNDEEPF
jgi:twinkle protein